MKLTTFDGWTNYETWAVALWINTDQASCHYWREQARRHRRESSTCNLVQGGIWNAQQAATYNLGDQLYAEFHDAAPVSEPNVYSDLLGAALGEVNWPEIAEHILADLAEDEHPVFGPVISAYSRTQAIEDGVLVDVSEMAREVGISVPTAVTAAVWAGFVKVPDGVEGQDEKGRLWDILNMLYSALRRGPKSDTVLFDVLVKNDNTAPRRLRAEGRLWPRRHSRARGHHHAAL